MADRLNENLDKMIRALDQAIANDEPVEKFLTDLTPVDSETPQVASEIPQIIDPGIVWLKLRMAHLFLEKFAPPYKSEIGRALIILIGLDQPGEMQAQLFEKLTPFIEKYPEEKFQRVFIQPLNTAAFSNIFEEYNHEILDATMSFLKSSVESRMNAMTSGGKYPKSKFLERIESLAETFGLSRIECEVLTICLLDSISTDFKEFVNSICNISHFFHDNGTENWNRINQLSIFFSCSPEDLPELFSNNSNFRRLNFFSPILKLVDEVYEFVFSLRDEPISDYYFNVWNGETLPLNRLNINPSDINAIKTILKNKKPGQGINILLGGPTGVGKTETVRSLTKELGLRLYEINAISSRETNDKNCFRLRALLAAQNMIQDHDDSAILIDEAGSLISDRSNLEFFIKSNHDNKSLLNEAMDRSQTVQFWVANDLDGIHPSTRRRFDYAIKYERATFKDRLSIWLTAVERYGLGEVFDEKEQQRLAENYIIDAGAIDSVLRNCANLPAQGLKNHEIVSFVEKLIQAQSRFSPDSELIKKQKSPRKTLVSPEYLTVSPKDELQNVLNILENYADSPENPISFSMLLFGAPGTGKTEFAKIVAERLGKPLHQVTAAGILSKYIGETEQRIRHVFAEAQREGAVLFFDEVDSLLHSRDRAQHSWEISQINEVLSALEDFSGVFIAATNHEKFLDRASMRRFHFQLNFDSLTPEAALKFYNTLLKAFSEAELDETEKQTLMEIEDLVPSDFASLAQRLSLQPKTKVLPERLIQMLQDRRDARSAMKSEPRIGFRRMFKEICK